MVTVTLTTEMMQKALQDVDWAKVDAMTDADIDQQIAEDSDTAPITLPSHVATALVRSTVARLGISHSTFATRFGIPLATLEDWEADRKSPDRTALSYLRVIAAAPDLVAEALQAA